MTNELLPLKSGNFYKTCICWGCRLPITFKQWQWTDNDVHSYLDHCSASDERIS